jgi:hypothetical protein
MRESQWIEWTRTSLRPGEREELLAALSAQQKPHLLEDDYVWVEGVGVLWKPPQGDSLRRACFTHGTQFETQYGQFYIDSGGEALPVRQLPPLGWITRKDDLSRLRRAESLQETEP